MAVNGLSPLGRVWENRVTISFARISAAVIKLLSSLKAGKLFFALSLLTRSKTSASKSL